jgi:hypothetical protein
MYADDLVIMSKSASGLQNALNKLHGYCSHWKLSVNITKTKIMIFNKSGHSINKDQFMYGNVPLQLCNEYSYLGITFTPSGSFTTAINSLKDKASKAFFKIRENLYGSSVKCSFKLFTTLLRPILSYGCEIWAPYLLKGLKNGNFINICDKISSETLHIKFCKLILGVHRKTTNNAVRGELGIHPLLIFMLSLSLKYWWKLNDDCLKGSDSLAIHALIDNRLVQNVKYFTWSNGIKTICKLTDNIDIWDQPNILHKTSVMKTVSSCLSAVYNINNEWYFQISTIQTKLRTYCTFKTQFNQENYVHMLNRNLRSPFCKLRVSAHQLMIEKGRYVTPRIPPENRICRICDLNAVEDEFHFIMKCTAYNDIRFTLFSQINEALVTDNFSDMDFFLKIMCASDFDIVKVVANYVRSAFNVRANLVQGL